MYLPEQELTSSSFQKKEFVFYQFEKKRMEVDPFISDGEECEFQREYVEERDGRKREYALKYMVATSTELNNTIHYGNSSFYEKKNSNGNKGV